MQAYGFGSAINRALGSNLQVKQAVATKMFDLPVSQVSCGWGHTAWVPEDLGLGVVGRARDFENTLRFGKFELPSVSPFYSRLGNLWSENLTQVDFPEPSLLEDFSSDKIVSVSAGAGLTACVDAQGIGYTMGTNVKGQCGVRSKDAFAVVPTRISTEYRFQDIQTGFQHCAGLTKEGEVITWGKYESGQLGLKGIDDEVTDAKVKNLVLPSYAPLKVDLDEVITQVRTGFNHTACLTSQGEVYTFGKFQSFEVPNGDILLPEKVRTWEFCDGVEEVYCGQYATIVQAVDGRLWHWGPPSNATVESTMSPTLVQFDYQAYSIKDVSIGAAFGEVLLLTQCGKVFGWSDKHPEVKLASVVPELLQGRVKEISMGWMHGVVLVEEDA